MTAHILNACGQWLPGDRRYCGATPARLYICGRRCQGCAPGAPPEVLEATGPVLRPGRPPLDEYDIELARRGKLRPQPVPLPACPEHGQLEQCPASRSRFRACACCGRVTARLDGDAVAWCGGLLPHERRAGVATTTSDINPS